MPLSYSLQTLTIKNIIKEFIGHTPIPLHGIGVFLACQRGGYSRDAFYPGVMNKRIALTLADSICDLQSSKLKKTFFTPIHSLLDGATIDG